MEVFMTTRKRTVRIITIIAIATLLIGGFVILENSLGNFQNVTKPTYAKKLFTTNKVHELNIIVKESDWQSLLDNAVKKKYIPCDVSLDGNTVKNVGIRTKGSSSLVNISHSKSDRYSFKVEFDHYVDGNTFFGLDKLALNNMADDASYMKDYMSYDMMREFGANAPLASFVNIKVNGEDWGLYLAVEGIEDAFAERNYGSEPGQIYKPEAKNMGLELDVDDDGKSEKEFSEADQTAPSDEEKESATSGEFDIGGENFDSGVDSDKNAGDKDFDENDISGNETPENDDSDVALKYTDDKFEHYKNIFDNAKSKPTEANKKRLIAALKSMNQDDDLSKSVDTDEVLRYFVVHNYLLNFDSYTGNLMHNYYLREKDGKLSMIAWDYNLAFVTFGAPVLSENEGIDLNSTENDAVEGNPSQIDSGTAVCNFPIDTPIVDSEMEDHPLLYRLLNDQKYMNQYHKLFETFLKEYFESGKFEKKYDDTIRLISPYVKKDPSAFCTYDEFLQAQKSLKAFCQLRAESVKGQLDGSIASTKETQEKTKKKGFIDASGIDYASIGAGGIA
jgi:spore coat protein CotH